MPIVPAAFDTGTDPAVALSNGSDVSLTLDNGTDVSGALDNGTLTAGPDDRHCHSRDWDRSEACPCLGIPMRCTAEEVRQRCPGEWS